MKKAMLLVAVPATVIVLHTVALQFGEKQEEKLVAEIVTPKVEETIECAHEQELVTESEECDECMASAKESCFESHHDCVATPECSDRLFCSNLENQSEGWYDDCYPTCNDDEFVKTGVLQEDLRNCACNLCELQCEATCNLWEG